MTEEDGRILADDWSTEQLQTLIERVEHYSGAAQRGGLLGCRCTVSGKKLDWQAIKFEAFSADACKDQWEHLMAKVGKIRTVKEILESVSEWLKMPIEKRGHAGLPKKPATPYLRYHNRQYKKLKQRHPDISLGEISKMVATSFNELSMKKKSRLKEKYKQEMVEYEERLQEFYATHPELKPIPKPCLPQRLFIRNRMKKLLSGPDGVEQDKAAIEEMRKKYLAKWHRLSNRKKTRWILKAVKMRDEYLAVNPGMASVINGRRFLTSEEQMLLDTHLGKPIKPPKNILHYYASIVRQNTSVKAEPDDHETSFRETTAQWKDISLLDKADCWRSYYEAVTSYQAAMKEWLSKQDAALQQNLAADEQKYNEKMDEMFAHEEECSAALGYTIRGPRGLLAFEQDRGERLATKNAEAAADSAALRAIVIEAYTQLSQSKRQKYEEAEVARLSKLSPAEVNRKRKAAQPRKRKGKKRKLSLEVDGVRLPEEPEKPPRSAYHTFLTQHLTVSGDSSEETDMPTQPKKKLTYLNSIWTKLSADEKEEWKVRWEAEKEHYKARMEAYKKNLSSEEFLAYEKQLARQVATHNERLQTAKKLRAAVKTIENYYPPSVSDKAMTEDAAEEPSETQSRKGVADASSRTASEAEIMDDAISYFDDDSVDATNQQKQQPSSAFGAGASPHRSASSEWGSHHLPEGSTATRRSPRKAAPGQQMSIGQSGQTTSSAVLPKSPSKISSTHTNANPLLSPKSSSSSGIAKTPLKRDTSEQGSGDSTAPANELLAKSGANDAKSAPSGGNALSAAGKENARKSTSGQLSLDAFLPLSPSMDGTTANGKVKGRATRAKK